MTHPLEKWLAERGKGKSDFAKEADISRMHLWRILNRDQSLTLATLQKVSDATAGAVSVADLLPSREPAQ